MVRMNAIVVNQPFAHLILSGQKLFETRAWQTRHRGELLIVAGKALHSGSVLLTDARGKQTMQVARDYARTLPESRRGTFLGHALGIVKLVDCRPMKREDEAQAFTPYISGLFTWELTEVRLITPLPVSGRQGLFDVTYPPAIPDASPNTDLSQFLFDFNGL